MQIIISKNAEIRKFILPKSAEIRKFILSKNAEIRKFILPKMRKIREKCAFKAIGVFEKSFRMPKIVPKNIPEYISLRRKNVYTHKKVPYFWLFVWFNKKK